MEFCFDLKSKQAFSDGRVGPAQEKKKKKHFLPARGFSRFRGAKMETEEPWESLDIDDSDLSHFLRPCNHRIIPGPAGAVQSAMIQRRTLGSSNTLPTQEFVRHVLQNGHDPDLDFNSNPWLSAQGFLIHSFPSRSQFNCCSCFSSFSYSPCGICYSFELDQEASEW